jgi:2-oxoglutarate dehydrogenase E1 component
MSAQLRELEGTSHLYGTNAPYIETFYEQYLQAPETLPPYWRAYFERLHEGHPEVAPPSRGTLPVALDSRAAEKQAAVLRLINAHRVRGHQAADVDPLRLRERPPVEDLDPAFHGLAADLDTVFNSGSLFGIGDAPLRDILAHVQRVYTGPIGAEYMHITDTREKRWIQERIEGDGYARLSDPAARLRLLKRLTAAEGLERYLHTRYVGQKRFSLEGGESLIPLLDETIRRAGAQGVKEIVIGMAHRGRLNVLVNTLGKQPCELFEEFEGRKRVSEGSGDVKYHLGFSADADTPGGPVHVALAFNPSHLEIIGPVVEGSVRARQQRRDDTSGAQVLPVLIHGDAAFAGQGVVMECLQLSQARGFDTGGTLHIVINNQIGFTTSNPLDVRSSPYCTDVAKLVQAPILHVNGDDPEAVLFVTALALDFRMAFAKDVVVDLICYRRHGHNEADEPAVTQPMMYGKIRAHQTPREHYAAQLIEDGLTDAGTAEKLREDYRTSLDQCAIVAPHATEGARHAFGVDWSPFRNAAWDTPTQTAIPVTRIATLAAPLLDLPEDFEPHPRVAAILADRRKMLAGQQPFDWGMAEILAYATLLEDGYAVRLSGQDSGRGTFFHRHAVLHNQRDGTSYVPLRALPNTHAKFTVIDSLLSEEAVLAFEYGYATAEPRALVIWEAQFGDFANGAQVVIDQFISSGSAKWERLCGLVLFLPHGLEGQGPEHSSARLERYLQLCADHNLQVCVPSTPAQMFHLLRRQMLRPWRRPLVVMTPKSLLRHRLSVSTLDDFTQGAFQPLIAEQEALPASIVRRVVLCAGKVYYDLLEARREGARQDVAILRVEQLYPFPHDPLIAELGRYPAAREIVWCQEEPCNQGAWYQIQHQLREALRADQRLDYAGRAASAAPATGHYQRHVEEQRTLVREALG